jgi:hypothetical protein
MGSGERKKAANAMENQSAVVSEQTDMARKLKEQSEPWTALAGKYYSGIAKGGDELTSAVAPQVNAATLQYQTALQKAKQMPAGGSRDRAIRSINLGEGSTKANIYSGGVNDAVLKLATMGSTGTGEAMGGYNAAGSGYANIAKSYSDMAQGKGAAAGGMASAGGGIAAAAISA